ncbi:hypothetical protein DFO73_11940 [Cytobacillus oceanisediminis]|uniref:Uncharacterized protein n=2 Tax=Cytobacillus oceanisediminis TaxID=665099 RepID=A0A2V2ZIE7_9BACI|nr:hypothetical protein DFO73_11940 [Cytobacillus oceanisediminis]
MGLAISFILSILLVGAILLITPLRLSIGGKLTIVMVSAFLALLGLLGSGFYPIWIVFLIQAILAMLISFLLFKKTHSFFVEDEKEEDIFETKPLFSIADLMEKTKLSETLDTFYSSGPMGSSNHTNDSVMPHMKKDEPETQLGEPETVAEYHVMDLLEPLNEANIDNAPMESEAAVAAEEPGNNESENIIEPMYINDSVEEGRPEASGEEIPALSSLQIEDDAELLMKARIEMFKENKHGQISEEESLEDLPKDMTKGIEKKAETEKTIQVYFDDLEELYLSRRNKKDI